MILPVVKYGHPALRQKGARIETVTPEIKQLIADMFETMYAAPGVGLAAPQVGVSRRLFVMDCSSGSNPADRIALVNPEILTTEGTQLGDEGCLSFPGLFFQLNRPQRVVARAQNVEGEWFELDVMDLQARCITHENDHLNGVVFISHLSPLKRDLVKRKIRKRQKAGDW